MAQAVIASVCLVDEAVAIFRRKSERRVEKRFDGSQSWVSLGILLQNVTIRSLRLI